MAVPNKKNKLGRHPFKIPGIKILENAHVG